MKWEGIEGYDRGGGWGVGVNGIGVEWVVKGMIQ